MKITKAQLTQLIKEELSNAMSEAEQWKMGRSMKAADLAAERGIADAQEDFARIQAGGKVLQIDTTEETQEEEDAYNKGWQNEMDRLKQAAADRKLNRPPEPETPEDIEAAQAEYDFESHFSEGKMKITKSKLAQIVQEELDAMKAEGYKAYKRDDDDKEPKRGLGESLAPYSGLEDYTLDALASLGGEQPVSDIAHVAGEAWAADNWSDDDLIDEDDMFYSAKEALQNLQAAGKVRLTQGGPDSSDEDFYALAQ